MNLKYSLNGCVFALLALFIFFNTTKARSVNFESFITIFLKL